ncbi:hypothetical protein HELRODRAFT_159194 [Helobdella robusta]|uniref:Peptidase M12B domain-containing protein n=1 Tax=Helobdella robusta TaxID=6412 RepID=T1ENQ5_HELRO|nr:hypothetical protein HELRODRAFT_159194 [Helobdella robusta]ESO12625.1 hypothetical protein HELRODRAFT_159194 [Helobdella robusta]
MLKHKANCPAQLTISDVVIMCHSKRSASLSSLTSLKEKRNKIVELYVAGDALFPIYYQLQGVGTREAAFGRIKSIVNAADALYNSVGIYLVLVGSEVWDSQQFTVYSNISLTLENWYKYKADYLNGNVTSHDNAALISLVFFYSGIQFGENLRMKWLISKNSGEKFDLDIVGLATLGSMCDSLNSGAVIEV